MSDSEFTTIPVHPCVKCGATERYKDGRCKACKKSRVAEWYATNLNQVKSARAAYHASNPSKRQDQQAAWAAANTDKVKTQQAAWYSANPDKRKNMVAAWQAANPDKKKATDAAWRAANPEALRIQNQNRRALKKKAGGTLSKGLSAKLFKLQNGKCPCCKRPLGDNYQLDHIVPLALGGSNVDDNIQLLRQRCNGQKNAKHPIDFMQQRGFLL